MTSVRQQLLTKLAELSELAPEYRFGQMICNLAHSVRDSGASAPWDIEDTELLEALEQQLESWRKNREAEFVDVP
jgi:hypothetical protein